MGNQLVASSSLPPSRRYHVFLSFRGEDTRTNFTDHLYTALVREEINTFIDRDLPGGEEISSTLLKAIEESRISVVILSKNYANSRWCLKELVKIYQCRESKEQIILPVFYKVNPSHVRHQTGCYGTAFIDHGKIPDKAMVLGCRRALTKVANLSGYHVTEEDYESKKIREIVDKILDHLKLAKFEVWYAAFGSNLCRERFLCYIEGGQMENRKTPYRGCMDKIPPKEIMWKTFHHRLFFGREKTKAWGTGGVAFLDPESNIQDKTYMRLYRITLEQFNDVLVQENASKTTKSPLFDKTALDSVISEEPHSRQVQLKTGWHGNVVYLGKEKGTPILTMTCSKSQMEGFKSGKTPLCAPAENHANTIARGLVEGKQLSEEAAKAYIQKAFKTFKDHVELSGVEVWYAAFGSDLCQERFLCYIEGGQMENRKTKEIMWKTFPHRLFFGCEKTKTWDTGGGAFLNPESNIQDKTYMCLYRITLEQFNVVLVKKNASKTTNSPLFDKTALGSVISEEPHSLQFQLKTGWYGNVVYLGKEKGTPILTMTCSKSQMDDFKSGKTPLRAPHKNHANTIRRGLVEGKQLSEEAAEAYIQEAYKKQLG